MECLQPLRLSADLAYTHVKHCLGASANGVSANAAPVSGFGVQLRETLTVLAQVPPLSLQMLHLLADLAYTHVKHSIGESTSGVSANASRFGVQPM